jgi:hypothetical protein
MKFLGSLRKKLNISIWEYVYHVAMKMIISPQFLSQDISSLLNNAIGTI